MFDLLSTASQIDLPKVLFPFSPMHLKREKCATKKKLGTVQKLLKPVKSRHEIDNTQVRISSDCMRGVFRIFIRDLLAQYFCSFQQSKGVN